MGGKIVVPEADINITKVIKNFKLTPKDVSDFWKLFQKLDKEKTGLVPLNKIFKRFEMDRTIFTDCLLDLLEIEHVCFYCFDQDKTGYVSVDDLNNLMNMVHNIKKGKTVTGTVKASWLKLQFKGEALDFGELQKIHDSFPRLFQPAFLLQQNMMIHTLGELWWTRKKRSLQDIKDINKAKLEEIKARKEARKQRKKNRKIQRNMGLLRYYLCPCFRKYYDPSLSEYDKLSEEQRREMDRQLAIQRRQNELKIKNPETVAWLKYQEKVEKDLKLLEELENNKKESENPSPSPSREEVGSPVSEPVVQFVAEEGANREKSKPAPEKSYLEEKISATARSREERAFLRNERKKYRMEEAGFVDKKKKKY